MGLIVFLFCSGEGAADIQARLNALLTNISCVAVRNINSAQLGSAVRPYP
jgi:hypothetical protein